MKGWCIMKVKDLIWNLQQLDPHETLTLHYQAPHDDEVIEVTITDFNETSIGIGICLNNKGEVDPFIK